MTDIDRSLLFGITVALAITLMFGVPGIICAIHGHVILGSILAIVDIVGCMLLVARG